MKRDEDRVRKEVSLSNIERLKLSLGVWDREEEKGRRGKKKK